MKKLIISKAIKPLHPTKEDRYIEDVIKKGLFLDQKAIDFFDLYPEKIDNRSDLLRKYIIVNDNILAVIIQKTDSLCDLVVDIRPFKSVSCFLYGLN